MLLRDKSNIHDIVLADFGLATELIPGKESEILFKRCGTPGYVNLNCIYYEIKAAPEVLKLESKSKNFYNSKCDIFSVGCIFYLL